MVSNHSASSPQVSVVIPAYNAEQFVVSAVGSILNQSFRSLECVVVDDGSTDKTIPMLNELAASDKRLRVISEPHRGLISALNTGFAAARGTYIARMDADDISLPTRLEKQVQLLEKRGEVGVVGTWIRDIDTENNAGPYWPVPSSPVVIRWCMMFGNCLAHPTVMIRRTVAEKLGFYRTKAIAEDYDLWIRASAITELANIPEVLLMYRVYPTSSSVRDVSVRRMDTVRVRAAAIRLATGVELSEEYIVKLEDMIDQKKGTPTDGDEARDLLRRLHALFMKKMSVDRSDRSEIALDIIRRLFSTSTVGMGSSQRLALYLDIMRFVPEVLTPHGIHKALSVGAWFARESPATRNSVLSWKRLRA